MAKSKVLKAEPNGSWEGQNGTLYKYTILFDNGDQGEYSSKSDDQNKFVVGEEVEYERIDKGKYIHIKPIYNFQPNSNYAPKKDGNVQEYIIKQSSLNVLLIFVLHKELIIQKMLLLEQKYLWIG